MDALDAVHFTAAKYAIQVTPQKGEMYFVNNLSCLHSRAAYKDDNEKDELHPRGRRRHLLRLWLRDPPRGRDMEGPIKERWERVFDRTSSSKGRWLLTREMEPRVISEKLFREQFPADTFNSCQNS